MSSILIPKIKGPAVEGQTNQVGKWSLDDQSQWTGPETFSFKAKVDFDDTHLAEHLMLWCNAECEKAKGGLDEELDVPLSWHAEDAIRAVDQRTTSDLW